ncbi:MAG: hypothetical protein NTX03_00325 [Bacteroidetes bacterium]|nr:hypothetical protein [Bacteroidota bacterium]
MNLRQQLLQEHSLSNTLFITQYIGEDAEKFAELMEIFLGDNYRLTQRAAWVVSHVVEAHPHLLKPYYKKFIQHLNQPNIHDAVKRNTIRVLQFVEVPKTYWGALADICLRFVADKKEPIAVRVFSLTVLANLCIKQPDLKNEILLLIEDLLPYASAGLKNRALRVRGELKKI